MKKRLTNAVALIFEELFHLCEINCYECDFLQPRKNDRMDEKALSSLAIGRYVQNILELLCFFARDFCQGNPGLAVALIEIITGKRSSKRYHACNKTTVEATFREKLQGSHVCEKSMLELLLMHSVFLTSKSEALCEFIRSLLGVSSEFQKAFIEAYLSRYQFFMEPALLERFYPEASLHSLFSEFTRKEHIRQFLSSHNFEHIFRQLIGLSQRLDGLCGKDGTTQQCTDLYSKAILPTLHLLRHLAQHICTYRLDV